MKQLEEMTLEEIEATQNQELLRQYYSYIESMKTNSFYTNIVEALEGRSLEEIYYGILEEEQQYKSEIFFPGDIAMFYPRIKEQKAKSFITCDFSAGIIYPGSLYVNYRPLIYNLSTKETFVLSRTIKVETGYSYDLPRTIIELESLSNKLSIDGYDDNSGIHYSHLSQCMGGEITLQKLKRRRLKWE